MFQIDGAPKARGAATMPLAASSQPANVDEKKAYADGVDEAKQTVAGSADSGTSERTEPISISGTVFDDNDDPLQGAHVYLVSSASDAFRKLAATISDADGHYQFTDIPLPIVTEKRYQPPRDVFGAFEVFATHESLGFTWRRSKPFYPDSPTFNAIGVDDKAAPPQRDSGHTVLDSPSAFFRDDQIKMDLAFNAPKGVRLRVVDDEGTPQVNAPVSLWNADPVPGVARELIGGNIVMNGMGFQTLYDPSLMPDGLVERTTDADGWFEYAAMPGDCEFRIQVAPEGLAERMIHVTTGENYTSKQEVVYTSGQELVFPRIQAVTVTVTFADTLKPAPNVWVHGGSWGGSGSSDGSTNDVGQITLKLPPGDCKFQVRPEYKTPYVFVDDDSLQMTVERDSDNVFKIQLQRAAEVEVLAVDAKSGQPVAGADLWTILPDQQGKMYCYCRSFEPPNVFYQLPKLTDSDGRIETFFSPGTHEIGLCKDYTPVGYQPMSFKDAVTIECKAGEKQTVTLKLKKSGDESGQLEEATPVKRESTVVAEIRYPHCLVEVANLQPRSLSESIGLFNTSSTESPIGHSQPPITEQETRDAIAKFAERPHVPEAVRERLRAILTTGVLPGEAYFRRFTRFDDERQMHGVWWVRLVVEGPEPPVYSVPIRTTSIFTRPYTQMERQQNGSGGLTLIGRVCSYYEVSPVIRENATLPQATFDRLIVKTQAALQAKDLEKLKAIFEWQDASESIRKFAESELQTLTNASIHSIKVTPRTLDGKLVTWSAWQRYKPNLPVVGFLEIEYSPSDGQPDVKKSLSLELGQVGDELRLVNYVTDGEPDLPKSLNPGPSISGHIEPLADGTYLVTDTIINPGTLLSAHLANEEVRQRDFRSTTNDDNAALKNEVQDAVNDGNDGNRSGDRVTSEAQAADKGSVVIHYDIPGGQRELLLKAVAEADQIPDDQARQKAQWDLVGMLVKSGLTDEAFQQAMKLKTVNPQTCIYSLTTIAKDAIAKGNEADVKRAWELAQAANEDAGKAFGYEHYVIELGFKLNRPVSELIAIASAAKPNGRQNAFRDIRNELAWRGRVDEAYSATAAHLPTLSTDFNDREIAYYCSSAKNYDYYLKHDHIGQAIHIIEKMRHGENRDVAISQLIDGMLYVANRDKVPEERIELAENWVGQIEDRLKQAAARAKIMRYRPPVQSIEELEREFARVTSREEKEQLLG